MRERERDRDRERESERERERERTAINTISIKLIELRIGQVSKTSSRFVPE